MIKIVKVRKDLTGEKFGRLTVMYQTEDYVTPKGKHEAKWHCVCKCGGTVDVIGNSLRDGSTKSCGCLRKENAYIANKKYNKYDLNGTYGIGFTSNTNKEFYFDLEDYDLIKDYTWSECIRKDGYRTLLSRDINTKKLILFHQIIGCKNYDHINRNTLDNRKENLRMCTHQENSRNRSKQKNNTSGFIGIYWNKSKKKWTSQIHINKKVKFLGIFEDKEEAIKVRLQAEADYYGEFAPQRHLFEQYGIEIKENNND